MFNENLNNKNKLKKYFGLANVDFIITSTSKVVKIKGVFYIVKAFYHFLLNSKFDKRIKLVISNIPTDGDYTEIDKINKFINEKKINDYVKFLGMINQNKIADLLKITDIWTSMAIHSNAGSALYEAMSSKNIVIASNVGGTKDIIINNRNGFLVPDSDFKTLSKLFLDIYKNYSKYDYIGVNARNFIVNNYSWDKRIEKEIEIYNQVLKIK
ncbi:MAG: glycosyltransferase [bacterium]|nr:glycosyltransferase [bacterium]